MLIEGVAGNPCERGMGDPGAIVAGTDFAEFVGFDASHGIGVGFGVVFDGDLGSHASL